MARRLEENNIIVNYQALPDDEGFSASSGLRMGVQEMTRFGMKENDFQELAGYLADSILKNRLVAEEIIVSGPNLPKCIIAWMMKKPVR